MSSKSLIRDFAIIYGTLTALKAIPRLRLKGGLKRNIQTLLQAGQNSEVFRHTAFALSLPRIYTILKRRFPNDDRLPIALSSLLIYFVKPSYRRTVVVYAAQTAFQSFKRNHPPKVRTPPEWTLLLVSNAWLLWIFLFYRDRFPKSYREVILQHSGYGDGSRNDELLDFLSTTKFEVYPEGTLSTRGEHQPLPSAPIHSSHTRIVCSRLHPTDPSCFSAYFKAWISQYPRVFKWVAAFGLLPVLLRRKPLNFATFKRWLVTALRGTAFVVGSINTSWALTCLFQRLLRPGQLPRLRWLANGFFGSLWVLALPTSRRKDFSFYTSRLAAVSTWDLLDSYSPCLLEPLVLLLAWTSLIYDKRAGKGPRGLSGLLLDFIDSRA